MGKAQREHQLRDFFFNEAKKHLKERVPKASARFAVDRVTLFAVGADGGGGGAATTVALAADAASSVGLSGADRHGTTNGALRLALSFRSRACLRWRHTFESKQTTHNVLGLLRPSSTVSGWNVRWKTGGWSRDGPH